MNSLYRFIHVERVFFGQLNVFSVRYVSGMTGNKCLEIIGEDTVEGVEINKHIARDVKIEQRHPAWCNEIDCHHHFLFWKVDDKVALGRVELIAFEGNVSSAFLEHKLFLESARRDKP